jgi:hypothetical protein
MTDRERQLESEVAWLRYGPERMNLALRERNAVWIDSAQEQPGESEDKAEDDESPEFNHVIVCGFKQCMASHRFGGAEPDNIFSSFDDDEEDRECIVKKYFKYHCEKAGLVCVECTASEVSRSLKEACHVALVDLGETWTVSYGRLLDSELFHENPAFSRLVSVFDKICADHHPLLEISMIRDEAGFFTDDSGTDYVAVARRRGFMITEGGETGAEFKARRQKQEEASSDEDDLLLLD